MAVEILPDDVKEQLTMYATGTVEEATLSMLFTSLLSLCRNSEKNIVLIIDEVDSAISLMGKLELYPELRTVLYELLFNGKPIPYVATSSYIKDAAMFGFIKNENDTAVISNRIFEAVLYNNFISEEFATSKMYNVGDKVLIEATV